MTTMTRQTIETAAVELNVELALRVLDAASEDELDAASDEIWDIVEEHAAELALGHVVSFDPRANTALLRFDVIDLGDAGAFGKLAEVISVIERKSRHELRVTHVEIEEIEAAEARASERGRSDTGDGIAAA